MLRRHKSTGTRNLRQLAAGPWPTLARYTAAAHGLGRAHQPSGRGHASRAAGQSGCPTSRDPRFLLCPLRHLPWSCLQVRAPRPHKQQLRLFRGQSQVSGYRPKLERSRARKRRAALLLVSPPLQDARSIAHALHAPFDQCSEWPIELQLPEDEQYAWQILAYTRNVSEGEGVHDCR